MLKTPRDTSKSRPIHVRENSISPFDAYRLVIAVRGRKVHVSRQTGVSKLDFLLWLYYALIHCKWSESLAISKARGSIYMSFGKWKIILSQSVIFLTSFAEFVVVSIETPEINCDRLFSLRVRLIRLPWRLLKMIEKFLIMQIKKSICEPCNFFFSFYCLQVVFHSSFIFFPIKHHQESICFYCYSWKHNLMLERQASKFER